MQKKLTLVHPDRDNQATEFVLGRDGVDAINRVDGGYAVDNGTARSVYPDSQVAKYWEELRPGMLEEPEEDMTRLGKQEGGRWACSLCGKGGYATAHALKIHHGRSHQ